MIINCWQYSVKDNAIYNHTLDCKKVKDDMYEVIVDKETDRHTYVNERDIEKVSIFHDEEHNTKVISLLSFKDNINEICEIIHNYMVRQVLITQTQYSTYEEMLKQFSEKFITHD